MLALALATGIGRADGFYADELIGRRMAVRADGHGGWCMEREPKPIITVTPDLVAVTDAAEHALMADPGLFVRAGTLVRIVRHGSKVPESIRKLRITPPDNTPLIDVVVPAHLRERMAQVAHWRKHNKNGDPIATLPPNWAVDTLLARGDWAFAPLERVVEAPTTRPDGTVLDVAGYDPATGILFEPARMYPAVPSDPTDAEVAAAINALLDILYDFPFVAASDRSAAIATMLTIAGRPAIPGPTPIFAYRAPAPGTGKGRCDEACMIGMTGRSPTLVMPVEDDAEWRKRLFAIGVGGFGTVLIDNVKGTFGSPSLSAAATTCEITDRVLGLSKMMTVPFRPVVTLTGNNVSFVDDMARRVVPIDLDANVERPEDRSGFRYPDLIEHVKLEHPKLLVAALTILRAFHVAGRPSHGMPKMGSFEAWDDLVRGAIVWLKHPELADPLGGRARIRAESDMDVATIAEVLHAWYTTFGSTPQSITDAIAKAKQDSMLTSGNSKVVVQDSPLMTALRLADPNSRDPRPNVVGYKFRSWRGRIVDGQRLEIASRPQGVAEWRVAPVAPPKAPGAGSAGGDGGDGGDVSSLGQIQEGSQIENGSVEAGNHPHDGNDAHRDGGAP